MMNDMGRKISWKITALSVLIAAFVAFRSFGLDQYLTLQYLRDSHSRFVILYAENRPAVILGYAAIYIITTSLSIPGAVVLTLAGGAVFGLWIGVVTVSFASTIGATAACFVSRFILRDWIQAKFGERLRSINKGIESEGAFYLFSLRLVPVFPFWLINLAMGLTTMPLRRFFWVSQVGMLPGTILYVNAGRELSGIKALSDILSPGVIISFAILGLFPVVAKRILALLRHRGGQDQGQHISGDST